MAAIFAIVIETFGREVLQNYVYKISKEAKSPIYLIIDDYPERIKGKYKVRIK